MELLKLSKKKMFGSSAEKIANEYGQISFFNEAEKERTVLTPEPEIEEVVIPKNIHILPTKELLLWSAKIPDNIRKTN